LVDINKVKINEADLDLVEQNLLEYFANSDEFKSYNFKAGALPAFIRVAKFVIRNLAFQLNRSIESIFLDTATLEDTIYSLIQNFNYIPQLNKPAKRYLKVIYDLESASYTPSASSTFKIFLNTIKYNDSYVFVPTLRDKWQQDYYTDISSTAYVDQNMFYYYMNKTLKSTGGYQLEATMPVYQAKWNVVTHTVNTADPGTMTVELEDGSGNYYGDKVIQDSIRVFVKETSGTWYEYDNLRLGLFDQDNLRAYNLTYDKTTGLSIVFDIDHLSRTLLDTEDVRIFFATTEGEDINDEQGNNTFDYEDVYDFQILEVDANSNETQIVSVNSTSGSDPRTISPTGAEAYFSATLVDGENNLAFFDNGIGKQTLDSMKISAPLFRVTQGRAVTETDYNYLLGGKFSEYKGIKAWSGAREYLDMTEMINTQRDTYLTKSGTVYSGSETEIFNMMTEVIRNLYDDGILAIDSVLHSDLNSGKYRRDLGFVYYSFFDDSFQFVNTSENTTEIIKYLDKYKILTMYFKYMNPVFMLLKPKIKLTVNPAYASSFSVYDMKKNIFEKINDDVSYDRVVDLKDLNGYLLNFDSVQAVDSISATAKLKFKNVSDTANDLIYVRTFTKFATTLNNSIKAYDSSNNLITVATITTDNSGGCFVNGDDGGGDNSSNQTLGNLRFLNTTATSGYDVLYIDDVKFSGLKFNGIRENVIGIESIEDIELIVE